MNIHLHELDVLILICEKYNIVYDTIKDANNVVVEVTFKNKGICVTWDGKGYEVTNGKN